MFNTNILILLIFLFNSHSNIKFGNQQSVNKKIGLHIW